MERSWRKGGKAELRAEDSGFPRPAANPRPADAARDHSSCIHVHHAVMVNFTFT